MDTCHTMDSFGGIGAGKSERDGAAGRLAFDRMWLTKGEVHVYTGTCTHLWPRPGSSCGWVRPQFLEAQHYLRALKIPFHC